MLRKSLSALEPKYAIALPKYAISPNFLLKFQIFSGARGAASPAEPQSPPGLSY